MRLRAGTALVVFAALCSVTPAWACRFSSRLVPMSATRQHAMNVDRAKRERAYVALVGDTADLIFVGRQVGGEQPEGATDSDWRGADFAVERVLKGKAPATLSLQWRENPEVVAAPKAGAESSASDVVELDVVVIGCSGPQDNSFMLVDLGNYEDKPGFRFLVYAKAGRILRANRFQEGPPPLTAEEELQLVQPPAAN
jgi:hypothetical protein